MRIFTRNSSEGSRGRGASGIGLEIPLQPVVPDHGEAAVSLSPW